MTELGIYVGNSPTSLAQFEGWLGREVDGTHASIGYRDWGDVLGSTDHVGEIWHGTGRSINWTVPLLTSDTTLAEAASGAFNDYYRQVAQKILNYGPTDNPINIRPGWEFNGDWFPWSAIGHEQEYIGAWRQFVDTFRSVSDRFVFEWNVNEAPDGIAPRFMNPELAYPGDDYVDIVGMDIYWNTAWHPSDPYQAWNRLLKNEYGLQWHQDFAAAHGKQTSYSEWGVMTDNAGPYINAMKMWFDTHDVAFQSRWESDADYSGKMSDGTQPNAGAAYVAAFRDPDSHWKLDGLQYIAPYGDLIAAFGPNAKQGVWHYFHYGVSEQRATDSFDAATYLANYGDLRAAFGDDSTAAAVHYITYGHTEGRTDAALF